MIPSALHRGPASHEAFFLLACIVSCCFSYLSRALKFETLKFWGAVFVGFAVVLSQKCLRRKADRSQAIATRARSMMENRLSAAHPLVSLSSHAIIWSESL